MWAKFGRWQEDKWPIIIIAILGPFGLDVNRIREVPLEVIGVHFDFLDHSRNAQFKNAPFLAASKVQHSSLGINLQFQDSYCSFLGPSHYILCKMSGRIYIKKMLKVFSEAGLDLFLSLRL